MFQIFNFNAGPAMLPIDVLKDAQQELRNWQATGLSVIETSHRSEKFIHMIETAEKDLRELLEISLNYKVLFCHGGGRAQFSAIPLNLLGDKIKADYINTGYWSNNAIQEAKRYCTPNIINASIIIDGIRSITPINDWRISNDSAYVHFCQNETIDGIAIHEIPNFDSTTVIVADYSSSILSEPINVNKFGVIYACTQKNIGTAGLAVVIIRENLLGKASKLCPSIFDYTVINNNKSIFNTPPTFSWYITSLVLKWLKKNGGVKVIRNINRQKAKLLYNTIDESHLYYNNINKNNRSFTNIPFYLKDRRLDEIFLREASSHGLYGLKGHRVAGGMRASIYNAMPLKGVKVLTDFMIDFELRYG